MNDDTSRKIDPAVVQEFSKWTNDYFAERDAASDKALQQTLDAAQRATSKAAGQWLERLAAAGIPTEQAFYEKLLDSVRRTDGQLDVSEEVLGLALKMRDVLTSRRRHGSTSRTSCLARSEPGSARPGVMPGGCTAANVTFKLAVGHFTVVNIIPGPGYVAATCGVDFMVTVRKPDGRMSTPFFSRLVLASAWIVLVAPIGNTGTVPETVFNPSFPVPVPGGMTEAGETWQFTTRAWAETGGAGFFIPLATAQINGSLYGFRVTGT